MMAAFLDLLALGLALRAWRAGRRAEPAKVAPLLVRLAIAAAVCVVLVPVTGHAPRGLLPLLAVATAAAALTAFDALAGLAFWGPPRRVTTAIRTVFAFVTVVLVLARAAPGAISFAAAAALLSYRWRAALGTVALFRTFLGAVALMVLFFAPIASGAAPPDQGWLGAPFALARIVRVTLRFYVLIGLFKSFAAFTRDPSLGIRTVTRRLALSHILVLLVPLAITLALWVSTTYLGANADRALAGRRMLDREADRLAAGLRAASASGEAAVAKLAAEQRRQWPGTRLWLARGDSLERVLGDGVPGEPRLAEWIAGLDTLPDRGVIGLLGRRWMGAAVRPDSSRAGAVILAPARDVLDSTLTPVLRAKFTMREDVEAVARTPADSASMIQAIRTGAVQGWREGTASKAEQDTMTSLERDVARINGSRGRSRTLERLRNGPRIQFSGGRRTTAVSVGTATERDSGAAIAFSGMAVVRGPEAMRPGWRRSEFMLVARADFRSTLAGLYANVRDNPLQAVPITMLGLLAMLLLPVALTDFSMVRGMGRSIAQATNALRDGASALGRGDLAHRIAIRGDDDLWETARQFNRMAEGLERARVLEKERDRLESELDLARRIQQRLLPAGPPAVPGLEIAGRSEPAREVGGDYYDHFDLGGGRVLLVIADVSGKGVPAALLMSGFRASLMSQDAGALGPERLAERVNEFLHRSVETGKFVTAFLGFLDAASGRLVYANAGHNPPALLRADGRVEWLAAGGVVLGILPASRFEAGEATLERGDLLALYTDGVTEGADAAHELWGEERLVAALHRLRDRPCAEAAESLVREVRAFEGDTGPADDITVLLARRVVPAA